MTTVTVPKEKVKKEGGVVILSLKEYERLLREAVPTYYLRGKEARALDKLVEESLEEYRSGKTFSGRSLKEALALYERKAKNKKN